MKRFVVLSLLAACSSGGDNSVQCQPSSCADYQSSMPHACGELDDGCGKKLNCGPCEVSDMGGSGGGVSCTVPEQATTSTSSISSSASTSGSSSVSTGQGGENMCQDLTFDK